MDEERINEIAVQVVDALNNMASGEPTGWEIFAALSPVAVLAGAVVTLWIGLASLRRQRLNAEGQSADAKEAMGERRRADDRAEWWKRVQWALDASLSEDVARQDLGFKMLARLIKAGNVDKEDLELLDPAWLRTAASSSSQAEAVIGESTDTLQGMANQGLISDDYLNEYRRIMDEQAAEEHNGTDTSNREGSDERNP